MVLALLDTMQRVKILPDTVYCSSQAMIGAVGALRKHHRMQICMFEHGSLHR